MSMNKPLVSVAVPVYNLEKYVVETLDSIAAQTYENFEVVIVDDGSTDSTAKLIEPYLSDSRFRYIRQENAGPGAARNKAISESKGEWIAFLDGDDVWLPDKLQEQVALAVSDPKANMIYGQVIVFHEEGLSYIYMQADEMPEENITPWIYSDCKITLSAVMFKTEDLRAINGFRNLGLGEDYDLWLRLAHRGVWARAVKTPIVRYRVRANSRVSDAYKNRQAQIPIMEAALEREDRPRYKAVLRKGIAAAKSRFAYELARVAANEDDPAIEKHLWESWRYDRGNYKRFMLASIYTISRIAGFSLGKQKVIDKLRNIRTKWEQVSE